MNGYVLISPFNSSNTYLIDNCGLVVNQWGGGVLPQLSTYLNTQGDMVGISYNFIQRHNWGGDLVWSVNLTSLNLSNHHDMELMPNGNILIIAGQDYSSSEAINNGRDSTTIVYAGNVDGIVEIQPIGSDSATVVWEWNIKDHLIQDFDASKLNFGTISDHPERLNINFGGDYDGVSGMNDWVHLNSVEYNPQLDHILISSRHTSEIYIIDHSTTTEEAAGHDGGLYNKGGDFLWRWGNNQIYNQGTENDRFFSGQHDPRWIDSEYENGGMISVFNNGAFNAEAKSKLCIIDPTLLSDGSYESIDGKFLPLDYHWFYSAPDGDSFFALTESGAVPLSNGNVLAVPSHGDIFEVNQDGEKVWSYRNPVGGIIINQGDDGPTALFKAQKYESDFQGFVGKELIGDNYIENVNTVSDLCQLFITSYFEAEISKAVHVYPNPATKFLWIESDETKELRYHIYTLDGKEIISSESSPIDISTLAPNLYLLEVRKTKQGSFKHTKFIKY